MKCDISKCFPSVNHQILKNLLRQEIACPDTLWLIEKIIDSFETGNEFDSLFPADSPFRKKRPRGIPIGNLTSQLFVNVYLDPLDKFVKNCLGEKYYLRYVDDFLILHKNKKHLHQIKNAVASFLRENLHMELHPKKQRIFPVNQGIDFLGYVTFKDFKLLRKSNKMSFRKKLLKIRKLYQKGLLEKEKIQASITSWLAHTQYADTYRLRKRIFGEPLNAKDQKKISRFIDSWKKSPSREPSGQLRLF